MNQDEAAPRLHHRPHCLAGGVVWGDRGTDGDPTTPGYLRRDVSDPADVDVTMLLREAELRREVLSHQVAVKHRHRPTAHFEQLHEQGIGDGRLTGARETGEENSETLAGARRVGPSELGCDLRIGEPFREFHGRSPDDHGDRFPKE